jgi:5'-nucleotidase
MASIDPMSDTPQAQTARSELKQQPTSARAVTAVESRLRLYIDMDGVLCDIAAAYEEAARTHPHVAFPQSIPGLFASLRPIPGALEAVAELLDDPRFDVWILSAPSTRNPACYSEKRVWVEKMFDYSLAKRLILASDKSLLRGDVLIDDNVSGKGQERFQGVLIHFGSSRFPTWSSVLEHLRAD